MAVNEYPMELAENLNPRANESLDEARNGMSAAINGKLLDESEATLGTYAGRELRIGIQGSFMRARFYFTGGGCIKCLLSDLRNLSTQPTHNDFSIRSKWMSRARPPAPNPDGH
jgi:hypothetical protein